MMPGETHSAAPGTAADLARCQGCASLQQNLNEYVEALITLKQKIINTDNLLTEYQKKCDDLQFARRENSTLHHQVEQMLQKISPLQKCQEELGSLKAELEEKKSSLKLYQDTHQEYTRVKEECLKSDAQKKKLEAKVKKLEEAAVKQTQDFKQLRNEKKILEKEFKKTQERLDEFSKQKTEKELRHIGTQISSDSHGSIDKRKVKLLLRELWLCVNTAHRLPAEGSGRIPEKPAKEDSIFRASGEDGTLPPAPSSLPQASRVQTCLTELSMEIQGDFASCERMEKERPSGAIRSPSWLSSEEWNPEVLLQSPEASDGERTDISNHGHSVDEDLQAAVDFFKLPPPLLSPVPSPPLGSSLGPLPSSLPPESYFGEYTDSSESDSAQLGNSADSVSEDRMMESPAYFGLSRTNTGNDAQEEEPTAHGTIRALNKLSVNKGTAVEFDRFIGAPKEPSSTSPLAWKTHCTVSPGCRNDSKKDILNEVKRQVEVREMDKPKLPKSLWAEKLSTCHVGEQEAAPGRSALCYSPLHKRPPRELVESEGRMLSSRMLGSHRSEVTNWTLTDASDSDNGTGSGHFQRTFSEVADESEEMQGSSSGESVEPEDDDTGDAVAAAELDIEASFSCFSTSVPGSVRSGPQSSQLGYVNGKGVPPKVIPAEMHSPEQMLHTQTLNTFLFQSEPPEHSIQEDRLENSLCAFSPELGTPGFNVQKSREVKRTAAVEGLASSLPHSVFRKATKDGHCESQGPKFELTLHKSGLTSLVDHQAGMTMRDSGFVKSTSWHHSDLLKRDVGERLKTTSDPKQETTHQVKTAAPASQNRGGSVAAPKLAGENASPVELKAAATLLPNQVSVIMKQVRPHKIQNACLEPLRPSRNEPDPAAEDCDTNSGDTPSAVECDGTRGNAACSTEDVAAVRSLAPEASASWRKLGFGSSGGSSLVEKLDRATQAELSFSSEDSLLQSQDDGRESVLQAELQSPVRSPPSPDPDPSGVVDAELLPTEVVVSGDSPVEEIPCRDTGTPDTKALDFLKGSPTASQNAHVLPESTPRSPVDVFPGHFVTTGVTFSSLGGRAEETADVSRAGLPGASFCCIGVREVGEDTEVDGSEDFSCNESEQEAEALPGGQQQDAAGSHPGKDSGDREAGLAQERPSTEVGDLTSALQDFNISTFPDIQKLSISGVSMFHESCQLRAYTSGKSVLDCSDTRTLSEEVNKELKHRGLSEETREKQPCGEEPLGAAAGWTEAEDAGDRHAGNAAELAQCSLETQPGILTRTGQELETSQEDCGEDTGDLLLFAVPDILTPEDLKENLPQEGPDPVSHIADLSLLASDLDGTGGCPLYDRSDPPHIRSSPGDSCDTARPSGEGGEESLSEPGEPSTPSSGSAGTRHGSGGAERTFQSQMPTAHSEVTNIRINTEQSLVIGKTDNWSHNVTVLPDVGLCIACGDAAASQGQGGLDAASVSFTSVEKSPENSGPGLLFQEPPSGRVVSGPQEDVPSSGQSTNFDKSRLRNRPVKPSIWVSSQIYDQTFETPNVASDHTYCNSKLESLGKSKTRSRISNKDHPNKPVKTSPGGGETETPQSEASQASSEERGNTKSHRSQAQPVLAKADTSTPTDCSSDTLSKIRQEVGPPLPPLLAPLIATPPRTSQPLSPLITSSSPSSPASPGCLSPSRHLPVPPMFSPWLEDTLGVSPPEASPSPSPAVAGARIVSSPLQFCAATPKHAVPVPGRLPPCAPGHAAVGGPQENSVKILDTMYPELSARARTLSILKGNIQLSRDSSADGKTVPGPVGALRGLRAIASTSTAFVKARASSGGDSSPERPRGSRPQRDSSGKRTSSASMLRSAKRLRLDGESPEADTTGPAAGVPQNLLGSLPEAAIVPAEEEGSPELAISAVSQLPVTREETVESHDKAIAHALKKISESTFDLLPVIRSHVYVGNISKKPVMRDEEKEVVYEFSTTKKHLAGCLLHSVLSELKIQKGSLEHSYVHALCRVYVGICRQLGDLERARVFCYSLLKEDFPESEKLMLFIANMWHDVFLSQSVINKAMQLVARQRAKGEVLNCLKVFLGWGKTAPVDVGIMVSKLLLTIQLCPKTEFQSSERFGEDLSDHTWEYIFAIDLLCCHQKWIWTHDNIISKELWPVMDKWIKYRKGHTNVAYTPDVIIASILRLIGRLGQLGLKEGFPTAVKNISSVIGMFIQHAQDEDIPWGIQLAAVYALCDLSPSNPAEIAKILDSWRRETSHCVPPAVLGYLEEVGSLNVEELR